jgi:hypothetical protein
MAARTTLVSDLIIAVRETLQDMDGDRYADLRIMRALNFGILETRRKRPDYWIGRYHEETQLLIDVTAAVSLPDDVLTAAITYAIGWIEMGDDEYSEDGRAVAMMKKFATDLEA